MSGSGSLKQASAGGGTARKQSMGDNIARYFALHRRKPRHMAPAIWRDRLRLGIGAIVLVAVVAATMIVADDWSVGVVRQMPEGLIAVFDVVTDFGKSVWILVPVALVLATIGALATPTLAPMSQRVLAAVSVRLGFLFLAIGLPGLVATVVKRLIGRARPLVDGSVDPFLYRPFGWVVEYASLPSGHAVDAFAIATAIGALWPRARALMWTYAVVIAASRVVLTAHFPSDVVVGAIVGTVGALLVRDWFAARGLAFAIAADGSIRPLPGPSWERIKRVARQLVAP